MNRDIRIELFDIIPYLEYKGISFITEGAEVTPGWIGINCLWCSDSTNHLGIHLASNSTSCWRCGRHSITSLVRTLENNCSFSEALEIMEKYENISRLNNLYQPKNSHPQSVTIPKTFTKLIWQSAIPNMVNQFLVQRGFNPEIIIRNKELYYGGFLGDYKFRLVIPITYHKQIVSYTGKDLTGKSSISYRNLEDEKSSIAPKRTLLGFDEVPPGGNVVVVEGPMDQWKMGPGSVATLGTAWTMEQVSKLRELNPNKVFILYDTEEDAQKSAKRLCSQIWFCECEVLQLNGINDPGDLTLEQASNVMGELK
jgi:hypothetical protein